MKAVIRVLLLSATAILAGCAGKRLATAPAGLDLDGTWQLNERETAKLNAPANGGEGEPARGSGGGMTGGRGRSGGGGPGGGGRMGGGGRPGGPGNTILMTPPLARFTIEQGDTAVFFRFTPKEGVRVATSWRTVKTRTWPGATEAELRAKWTEGGLVLERKVGEGGSMTEVYSRAPQSTRLIITGEVPGGRKLRRVYDLVPPSG